MIQSGNVESFAENKDDSNGVETGGAIIFVMMHIWI